MIHKKYFYIMILPVFMVSCSSSQLGWKSEPEAGEKGEKYIEDFDPLTLNEDFDILEDNAGKSENEDNVQGGTITTDKELPIETEEVTIQGYRVQLLATPYEDLARKAKQKAIYKIQEKVYLEFASPLWKIRVGDCKTRKEAEELKEKVKRIGSREGESEWTKAWIVPSQITVERKIER
ncbi:MAG: SPOR domain-containing protein [bacterium]